MSRFIDADACEEYFYEHLDDNGMAGAMNAIREMPTANVRKNVHGEWLVDKYNAEFCSVCGKHPYNDGEYYVVGWYSDFCPNCGALMSESLKIKEVGEWFIAGLKKGLGETGGEHAENQ